MRVLLVGWVARDVVSTRNPTFLMGLLALGFSD